MLWEVGTREDTPIDSLPTQTMTICLGFADYSGSHVLQYPIVQRTYAFVQRSTSETVRMMSIPKESFHTDAPSITWTREIPTTLLRALSPSTLRERLDHWYSQSMVVGEPPNWPSYIMGVIGYLLQRANLIDTFSGLNVLIVSDVPCNKGLASSAALEVSLARAGKSSIDGILGSISFFMCFSQCVLRSGCDDSID